MTNRSFVYQKSSFNSWTVVLFLVLFLVGLYYITNFIFWLLTFVAPILIIATLIIDYKVITGYIQWVFGLFKKQPLFAVGMVLFTVFGYAIVGPFLFGKALLKRKIATARKTHEEQNGEYIEYVEVKDEPKTIELPPIEKENVRPKSGNSYEQLFNE